MAVIDVLKAFMPSISHAGATDMCETPLITACSLAFFMIMQNMLVCCRKMATLGP